MSSDQGTPTEIVAVGRELLTGHTIDSNSAWIATRLGALGAAITRIVVVDDDPSMIARELREGRARGAALLITTGGLGPTFDDRTLEGVAAATGRTLVEHDAALAFVARRYRELAADGSVADPTVTPPRRKMARLPAGAVPVDNPVGTAPGVFLAEDGCTILSLPGVPAEMRAVVEAAVPALAPRLAGGVARVVREVASGHGDESVLAAVTERVMADVPGVYLKSLPTSFAPGRDLRIRITAVAPTPAEAEERAARARTALLEALGRPDTSEEGAQ
jgi:molybdenum cofactor synthesis domain-containing protein